MKHQVEVRQAGFTIIMSDDGVDFFWSHSSYGHKQLKRKVDELEEKGYEIIWR